MRTLMKRRALLLAVALTCSVAAQSRGPVELATASVAPAPKAGHFVFTDPQSDVWPQVMASVRRLLAMP
jgi:hypothetical protein